MLTSGRYLFNDAEVKSFDSAQLASECFGGEMTVRAAVREIQRDGWFDVWFFLWHVFFFIFQTKTYDSVTDKFMDFSFEKVRMISRLLFSSSHSVCLIVQKVILKYWLNLQTHSAYMLFYKRVELEEENGKDFSFDVSPDLLEVRGSASFSLNHMNTFL